MPRGAQNGTALLRHVTCQLIRQFFRCSGGDLRMFGSALLRHMLVLTEWLQLVQPGSCMLGDMFAVARLGISSQTVVAEQTNTLTCMV